MNPDILARYAANRLRVVRQVHYSTANENAIDLVLFLNGLPVATVELKTDFTQSVQDAIDQYRFDRHPRPKGQSAEPLLAFPSGALVHFAVSNSEVYMTTRLDGPHDALPALQQGRPRAARATRRTRTAIRRAISGKRSGRGTAGWKSSAATSSPQKDKKKQIKRDHLPALPPARRHAEAQCKRCWPKARAANI